MARPQEILCAVRIDEMFDQPEDGQLPFDHSGSLVRHRLIGWQGIEEENVLD